MEEGATHTKADSQRGAVVHGVALFEGRLQTRAVLSFLRAPFHFI
jgi:hypothetical protein